MWVFIESWQYVIFGVRSGGGTWGIEEEEEEEEERERERVQLPRHDDKMRVQ